MYVILIVFVIIGLLPYSLVQTFKHSDQGEKFENTAIGFIFFIVFGLVFTIMWLNVFSMNVFIIFSVCLSAFASIFLMKRRKILTRILRMYYFAILASLLSVTFYEIIFGQNIYILLESSSVIHSLNILLSTIGVYGLGEYIFVKSIGEAELDFFFTKMSSTHIIIILILLSIKAVGMLLVISNSNHSDLVTHLFFFTTLVECFFVVITIFYISKMYNFSVFKYRHDILNETYTLHLEHLSQLEAKSKDIRRLSHDIHNHKIVLHNLIISKQYDAAVEYLDTLHDYHVVKTNDEVLTEHVILNGLCNQKKMMCEQSEISTRFEIEIPKEISITDFDLCVIVGNLFDNAIEATQKCPHSLRRIRMKAKIIQQNMLIVVENNFSGELVQRGDRLITSKADGILHGVGLSNVELISEKYNGDFTYYIKEKQFIATVRLPLS